jgi:hypothetical protein
MDIKPIEVVETIKRFGLKFKKVTRTFESLRPVKSYEDLVIFQNEAVFNTIEVPEWFDAEKLVRIFSQQSIESYEKDTELKKAVEYVRTSERKGRPLLSFIQFIKNRFKSERDYYIECEAERFLNSNFPLSFYNKFVVFNNLYWEFLCILEDRVRWHEFRASSARNFLMYQKRIAEMKTEIGPLVDKLDECIFSLICLKRYVIVWNSKEYSEIFSPKFLNINNVDFSKFEKLYNNFITKLRETKELLLYYNPEMLSKEIDLKDYTAKMFGKLVTLPSSSLNLKR